MKKLLLSSAVIALSAASMPASAQTEITLGRFFGACEDAGTDVSAASGEACIVQAIINSFSEADNGIVVDTLPTDWGNYYDQVIASYAGGTPPDVHVMHRHRVPEFAGLGALAPIGDDLASVGIDPDDWSPSARDAVTYEGQIYGVPFDIHANLWHVNMDLMEQAGLVAEDGTPILPSSPEELLAHAEQMNEATGQDYLAADFAQFPIGVRLVLALLWQQDSNVFADGEATIDTPEARQAVEAITQLFDADYANPQLNYNDSQQAFLNGEAAILVNGTWVVDFYTAQADDTDVPLDNYYVASFPTLFDSGATWADSHMWVVPSTLEGNDPERYEAALELLAWINDHNADWARTGHLAVRQSVVSSDAYNALPHRDEYADTADLARDVPPTSRYGAIQDALNRELQAIWLTGKPVEEALSDADSEVQQLLN